MTFKKLFIIASVTSIGLMGCEDPEETFNPRNPDLAIDAVVGTVNSSARLLEGCERQLAIVYQEALPVAEIASDNYTNTQTFFNQFLDNLSIDYTDSDIDDLQFAIQRLRALANLGLNDIGPADPNFSPNQEAEFYFFRGLSQLLAGSYFNKLPIEANGALADRSTFYQAAIDDFTSALAIAEDDKTKHSLNLARARAYYQNGNCSEAVSDAETVINNAPSFVRYVMFDAINGPSNTLQDAIFDRGSFDDLQPLPRLDFLDPKYNNTIDPSKDYDVPYLKVEEAHLIIAESLLANGDLDDAKARMKKIVDLVESRPKDSFKDAGENRTERAPGTRPNIETITVAASPSAPAREGLVLTRGDSTVTIPVISGTSVDDDFIDDLDNIEEAVRALYLMRQEIFIAEGRRIIDMGVTFVPSENELLLNENVTQADVEPVIPPFINSVREDLDAFDYNTDAGTVTIKVDVNDIIAKNRDSEFIAPCF